MSKTQEALKLALEALEQHGCPWIRHEKPYNEAITAIREALAEQPAQQEPVVTRFSMKLTCTKCGAVDEGFLDVESEAPPASKPWVGLMRGVRVDGDTVVISVNGGNENARLLCGELLREKNA